MISVLNGFGFTLINQDGTPLVIKSDYNISSIITPSNALGSSSFPIVRNIQKPTNSKGFYTI